MVSVRRGSKINTVFSCINVLAQDVAKLPYNVMKEGELGKEVVRNNPVYSLIHKRPNNYTTGYNFWYRVVFDMLSHGNAYAIIVKNGQYPAQLLQLPPLEVKVNLVEDSVYYTWNGQTFGQDSILHFYMYSFDGCKGVSPIIWNAETFGYRLKQDKYKARVLGEKPPGVLTFDHAITDLQMDKVREMWKRQVNGDRVGGTPVLPSGAKYTPFMIPPNEGQMIESAKLNREEICGIYRIPPTMVQDYERATFSNAEQQDLVYLKYSLTPILRVIEQECDYKLFSSRSELYTKFNVKAMLRGDIKTQGDWYRIMTTIGAMSPNDVRRFEDLPAIPEGDIYYTQGANIPLNKLEEFYTKQEGEEPVEEDENQRQIGYKIQQYLDRLEIQNGKGA